VTAVPAGPEAGEKPETPTQVGKRKEPIRIVQFQSSVVW
jgi:hypothetical protein